MIDPQKVTEAVYEYFGVKSEQLRSKSAVQQYSYPRKLICYILREQKNEAQQIVNRSPEVIRQWINQVSSWMMHNAETQKDIDQLINLINKTMTVKINISQLNSLYAVLNDFLSKKTDDVGLRLLCLHIDDIKEKIRKNIRNDKPNLKLDDKQQCAFMVWHLNFSQYYEGKNSHGYMTILDVINQLKPIHHAKNVPD